MSLAGPRSTPSLSVSWDHVRMLPWLLVFSALGLGAWGEFLLLGSECFWCQPQPGFTCKSPSPDCHSSQPVLPLRSPLGSPLPCWDWLQPSGVSPACLALPGLSATGMYLFLMISQKDRLSQTWWRPLVTLSYKQAMWWHWLLPKVV